VEKIKKQFIAGAVCPKCSGVDKIRAWKEGEMNKLECVSCGFNDEMKVVNEAENMAQGPGETGSRKSSEAQVIRLPK